MSTAIDVPMSSGRTLLARMPYEVLGRGKFGGRYPRRICPSRRLSKATIFC